MISPPPAGSPPEILLAILTDLSTDYRCFKLARSLKQMGFRPVIYCDRPRGKLGEAWSEFDVRVLTRESHQARFFPVFFEFLLKLVPALLKTRARIWISLDAPPLFWLALWGKLRGRTVVYDSHELFTETPMVLSRASRRVFWTLWERGGFALISRAITVSPGILDRLKDRHPRVRFYLLPNMPFLGAAPASRLAGAVLPDFSREVRLVYQGGLRAASGLPELFQALADRPRFTLDIYGDGGEAGALRAAALRAGIADRVRFHGSVPFEALPALMAGSHFGITLVQPVCESFALTWSNKNFDYVHAGLPVLLSDNPAHRSLLRDFPIGVTADAYSPESIGRALEALCADYAIHLEACREARLAWHWEAYAAGLKGFLGA